MTNTNELRTFEYAGLQLRLLMISGEPWFLATDVCRVLGHSNASVAVRILNQDERAKSDLGCRGVNVVSESGLYKLIMRSDKPEARKFQDWVTREVFHGPPKAVAFVPQKSEPAIDKEEPRETPHTPGPPLPRIATPSLFLAIPGDYRLDLRPPAGILRANRGTHMELTKERRGGARTKQGLRELFRCMEILREVNAGMPTQMASVFLIIAMKPGIHQRDLGDLVNISQSSISRNVNALAAITRHGTPGLGLVEQRIGSLGAKSPELHLSATGKALVKRLLLA